MNTAIDRSGTPLVEMRDMQKAFGGIRAVDADGKDLGGHQAFWFAWSQFHPDTTLWPDAGGG